VSFRVSEEQVGIGDVFRRFADREMPPRAADLHAGGGVPADLFRRVGEPGVTGLPFSLARRRSPP
jgi:short-chain 2-methylacyl-CoA dehydrogenase